MLGKTKSCEGAQKVHKYRTSAPGRARMAGNSGTHLFVWAILTSERMVSRAHSPPPRHIRGAEHHKTTLTQPSPTSFQRQGTLCDKCCCILLGVYTVLGLQQPLPTSLAPCLTCSLSSQTFLHTSCKFQEFPRYFVHRTVCFGVGCDILLSILRKIRFVENRF